MSSLIRSWCTFLLLSTAVLSTSLTSNDTLIDELRRPRVVGRIVKLYSGSKPEPIVCAGEGFQADPVDCAVFYRCIKGGKEKYTVFRFQCGPGTIYDPDTEICNHPKSTKRSECFGSAPEVTTQTDMNNENEIDFSKSQELPSPIKINKPVYVAHNAVKRNDNMEDVTVNPLKTTANTLILNQKPQISNKQGDSCISEGFMGDSDNCRKFYRCVGNGRGSYIRYEFSCSETTVWDDEVQSCNHPTSVKRQRCGRDIDKDIIYTDTNSKEKKKQITPDSDIKTIQEQTQINYGSKVSQLQIQINNKSSIKNQTQINYGDRVNQSQRQENYDLDIKQNQKQMSKESAISQSQTQINLGNNAVQSQVQIDHTKQTSQTQIQTSETDDEDDGGYNNNNNNISQAKPQEPQVTESNAGNGNDKQCTSSGFMGDPDNCKKFYRCVDNSKGGYTRYEFSCGDGTVWDASIEGCNHAWAVKKCNKKAPADSATTTSEATSAASTETVTKTTPQPETATPSTTTTRVSTTDVDDEAGYGNQNQVSPTNSTPAIPTNAPQSTTEGTSNLGETICTHNGFIGDESDCKKFYRCVDNGGKGYIKYEFSCGEGTVWDSEIEACNHAWAVKKCGGAENSDFNKEETTTQKESNTETPITSKPTSNTEADNNEDSNGYGKPVETSAPVTTTETQQTQAPVSTSNNECESSGFMGDQNDCKKFYRCVDNGQGSYTRYEFSCGEGTVWDQTIEGCNHVWAVKTCGNSGETQTQPQNEVTIHETSTTSSSASETDESQVNNPTATSFETTSTTQSSELTENPSKGEECTEEGFFADENDCRKFYRCVDDGKDGFIKYEFTCGEGTVWDSAIQGCNHPSNENKCRSSGGTSSSTTPPNEPDRENDEIYTETTSKSTTTTTVTTVPPATTEGSHTLSSTCQSEGFHPDPNDCKKFYRCVDDGNGGYTKYDFICGDGTVWDQNIQGCNHESENRDCKSTSSNDNGQLNQETTTQQNQVTTNQETITEGQKPTQEETLTKPQPTNDDHGQCTSDGFFANPSDCKKFYRCVSDGNGGYTRYDFTCGEGTVWVQEIQACDHDDDVNSCSSQSSIESSTSSSQTTQQSNINNSSQQTSSNPSTSTQSQTPTDEYPTESPSSSSSTIASNERCKSEGFFANENDCTKFYRCVDNGNGDYTKYNFVCGEGTAWDSNIQACNHKSEVESCNGSSQEKPETQPMQDEIAETQSTTSATTYSGSSSTMTTSTSGPCKNDSGSDQPSSKDKCTREGYYGNSQDCTKFYRCVDNGKGGFTRYDFQCGEGTVWDQDITACNHPGDVNNPSCNNPDQNSDTSSSTTSSSHEEPMSSSQSSTQSIISTTESNNQSVSNCSQEDSSKKPGKSQVNCTKAGFYPDPKDCKKFYRCVDWDGNGQRFSVFHFDCGEGTIWDPQLDTCNYEESVYPPRDCSGTDSQSETPQETTTTAKSTTTMEESTITTEREQSSTTEQQTNTEETTTQQSTTSEKTTTQQSTTSELTTQQTLTSEQTTMEQITQQTTVSQQTTTEKSTTTQQTTTIQPTSQQTTTEQSTASEQTTTELITTSEQTTTEQTTTSEQSTTEQSNTSEQTTTEQPATTEQTTTQQSTTSEDSITTQSTTSEETTTQQSTTEQSTSDSSTTQDSTTQHQDSSTTEPSTGEQQTTTEQSSSKPNKCPDTDDDQYTYVCPTGFRRHPKYCNLFYQCTEDDDTHEVKVATFTCPNNTIYDENKTQCVEESKAEKKCDGQIAQKRRVKRLDAYTKEPMVVSNEKHNCPAVGHFPFERRDECSPAFLKCEQSKSGKVRGFVYQCPDGFVYWSVSRRCEPKSSMRSCKQTANNWSGRWEIPVERRNVAPP